MGMFSITQRIERRPWDSWCPLKGRTDSRSREPAPDTGCVGHDMAFNKESNCLKLAENIFLLSYDDLVPERKHLGVFQELQRSL